MGTNNSSQNNLEPPVKVSIVPEESSAPLALFGTATSVAVRVFAAAAAVKWMLLLAFVLVVVALAAWLGSRRSVIKKSEVVFTRMRSPMQSAAGSVGATSDDAMSAVAVYRPYAEADPANYYGAFELTAKGSARVVVSSDGYFETVVYRYPEWEVVHAATCTQEVALDFLPPGVYAAAVFGAGVVSAALVREPNVRRPAPRAQVFRGALPASIAEAQRHHAVEAARLAARTALTVDGAPERAGGPVERLIVAAAPEQLWPRPAHTRVEHLSGPAPKGRALVVIPAGAEVVEGAERLGKVVHVSAALAVHAVEGDGSNINMRIVAQNVEDLTAPTLAAQLLVF